MEPEYRAEHLRLWTDVTRHAQPGYIAAPASLLAFVAWQSGHGALANVALDRALADDPAYSMAGLIRDVTISGMHPADGCPLMTPGEVAAAYGEDDRQHAEDVVISGELPGKAGDNDDGRDEMSANR